MALVLCLSLLVFFRNALLSRLTFLYGDSYDGYIEISILEHWFNVFVHGDSWTATNYFYPYADTLGYNDTDVVPGIFFTIARLLGSDPFLATFLAHVVMKTLGFLGMYVLLRRGCRVRLAMALAGAALFATANASLLHMHHAQLLSVGLIPWLTFSLLRTFEASMVRDRPAIYGWGSATGGGFGVVAFNAFYAAWFFAFFMILFAIIGLVVAGRDRRSAMKAALRDGYAPVAVTMVIAIMALAPLLVVYLPKLSEGAHHSWAEGAAKGLLTSIMVINVGPRNMVWGPLLDAGVRAITSHGLHGGEARFGVAPGLLLLFLGSLLWAFRHRDTAPFMLALACTVTLAVLLMTRWPGGFTAWRLIYHVLPGADAVRVLARFLLFALVPIIMTVTMFLDRVGWGAAVLGVIVAFLLIEEVQLGAPMMIDRQRGLDMLAAIGPPPALCRSFFVVSARTSDADVIAEARRISIAWNGEPPGDLAANYPHNADAMLLAGYVDRPTINGFSTFNPPDWAFWSPQAADYLTRVRGYVARHRLDHICGLDMRTQQRWFPLSPRP